MNNTRSSYFCCLHADNNNSNNNKATGQIHKHGSRRNPCPGSGKPAAVVQTSQPLFSQSQQAVGLGATAANSSVPASQSASVAADELSHPQWKTLVSRIPRAARPACRELLTQILRRIVSSPNDKSAWRELLHFGPVILAKPKRGGVNRNLSNVINKRTASWDTGVLEVDPAQQTVNSAAKRMSDTSRLAAAVTSKIEAGNFKAAIRIVCSEDTPALIHMKR